MSSYLTEKLLPVTFWLGGLYLVFALEPLYRVPLYMSSFSFVPTLQT